MGGCVPCQQALFAVVVCAGLALRCHGVRPSEFEIPLWLAVQSQIHSSPTSRSQATRSRTTAQCPCEGVYLCFFCMSWLLFLGLRFHARPRPGTRLRKFASLCRLEVQSNICVHNVDRRVRSRGGSCTAWLTCSLHVARRSSDLVPVCAPFG